MHIASSAALRAGVIIRNSEDLCHLVTEKSGLKLKTEKFPLSLTLKSEDILSKNRISSK